MSGTTALIFGTQLYADQPALHGADRVLMVESAARLRSRRWHAQKLIFVLSAMRHYAQQLRERGIPVDYRRAPNFETALQAHIAEHQPECIQCVPPHEYAADRIMRRRTEQLAAQGIALRFINDDPAFLCSREVFAAWARGKRQLVLENFYRWQRQRLGYLMDGAQPVGGRWNFDTENRQGAATLPPAPPLPFIAPDALTQSVIEEVRRDFPHAFGAPEPFRYPVTHTQAEAWLERFITERLANFGAWEDAMSADDPFLFHSVLSLLLNVGLLTPRQAADAAQRAFEGGGIPLQSAEGFIRQIIGWREFIYGVYWLYMPAYAQHNYFEHHNPVPDFFWSGETPMRCLAETVRTIQRHAYTHHIPRLMLLVNFGNLAALDPDKLTDWFMSVYIDAYDWVMQPNVRGFLYADGGKMATKPYVASAAYIKKMSRGYCDQCYYDADQRVGERACPFNALYWDFLARHAQKLTKNHRMALILKGLARRDDLLAIQARAEALRRAWSAQSAADFGDDA
ncbi:MAG: cryptochrome/photolyase family protein [Anaerolineae bacterium]|nr:cryptochrome/photolyase family protein [Anaerolineae bacterium]